MYAWSGYTWSMYHPITEIIIGMAMLKQVVVGMIAVYKIVTYMNYYNHLANVENTYGPFRARQLKEGLAPSIPFARFKQEGVRNYLCLEDEALSLLNNIAKPVAVLSICGPYRTGKSYFLSQMLNSTSTFQVGCTTNPCTTGIWMATSVLESEEFVIVLLDTEGTDASTRRFKHGDVNKSIVICTLLSSYFIYNSCGAIRQSDLRNMR